MFPFLKSVKRSERFLFLSQGKVYQLILSPIYLINILNSSVTCWFSGAGITHLPVRSSLVNGYGSPSSSWNGQEHSVHLYAQGARNVATEGTGKKKKKRKKAEVAMIAESEDFEESDFINKAIDIHRGLDSGSSSNHSEMISGVIVDDDQNSEERKPVNDSSGDVDLVGDNTSEISVTMELPVAETVLHQSSTDKFEQTSFLAGSNETFPLVNGSDKEEVSLNNAPCEEKIIDGNKSVDEGSNDESDLIKEELALKPEEVIDGNHSSNEHSERQGDIDERTSIITSPEMDNQSSSQNPFEDEGEVETVSTSPKDTDTVIANEPETPEYYAALAAFECGTPKKVDSIWQIERERGMSAEFNASYEGEDLNIVPGIHKSYDTRSRSESSGSFNGSGSQRSSRNNTLDSMYRTFTLSSTPGSWPGRNSFSSRKSSKADLSIGSPGSESQFSEFEMFDELIGLEEDHFSPPEVSVSSIIYSADS